MIISWVVCKISLTLDLPVVFLMIRLKYCVLGRKTTEVKGYSHHLMSSYILSTCVSYFFTIKLFFSFPCYTLWTKITVYSLHFKNEELCFTPLRVEYLHKLFGILYGRFVSSPLIYLFNY